MFYKREGFPHEEEITLCTVKKILHNSIFASLDEYKDREGIIHISEIAPGRIRTIREYVREGKKILCYVLRINKERNHIELSLRRVTTSMRIKKNQDLQLELKSEKILEILGKQSKLSLKDMYDKVGYKIIEKYGSLGAFFKEAASGNESVVQSFIADKKLADKFIEIAKTTFKPQEL
ncbi:MAG: S1 RNA-binding domain-containing protein, partial [Nanoarchaeota archaeon]